MAPGRIGGALYGPIALRVSLLAFVWSHWLYSACRIMSNTVVISMRECLSPAHPIRRLLWPFTHTAVSINFAYNFVGNEA